MFVSGESSAIPSLSPVTRSTRTYTLWLQPANTVQVADGRIVTYVGDWDVEVSMGVHPPDPLVERSFFGPWVQATLRSARQNDVWLSLEVHADRPSARLRRLDPTPRSNPIELPRFVECDIQREVHLRAAEPVWIGRRADEMGTFTHVFAQLVAIHEL